MRQYKNEHKNQPSKLAAAIRRCCQIQPVAAFSIGLAVGLGTSTAAVAGPEGGVVTAGAGTITQNDVSTTIDQWSNFLRVDWQSFNVAANESVLFNQPGSSSVALNRIHDNSASQIFGTVQANGQIFLINSNGILFGRTAQVNVGSLVASSLDVMNHDAATGRFDLGGKGGAIVNDGTLVASRGGSISLIGGTVSNNGLIVADYGVVNLASGATATLDFDGDGLMRFEVDGALDSGSGTAVNNAGTIQANGGQVFLTAEAAHGVFDRVINNEGVIRANRIENVGGTIRLLGPEGTVINSGTLDASGVGASSTGGTVSVLGDHVGLFGNARVDVSGDAGGGTALIGGDYQGSNADVLNASRTVVARGVEINAGARVSGDGGRVIVWSDDFTRYEGTINARGAGGGNGGFAEVSGKELLSFSGRANLGRGGTLLLDPRDITIDDAGTDDLAGDADDDDGIPNVYSFGEDDGNDATIAPATILLLMDDGTSVTLQANDDITVNDSIDAVASGADEGGALTLQAGDAITIAADVVIRTNNGDITISAGDDNGTPDAGDDDGGVFTMSDGSLLAAGTGNIDIDADGNARITSITTTGNVDITSNAGSIVDDADQATRISGAVLTLAAATNIGSTTGTNDIDTNGGSLTATATTGNIVVTDQASIVLNDITAGGNVEIVAGTSILDDDDNDTAIVADNVILSAAGFVGNIVDFAAGTGSSVDIDTAGTVEVTVTDDTGQIHLNFLQAPDLNADAIELGDGDGATGQIVLRSPIDFDTSAFANDSIVLGANNAISVGLRSGGTLTLSANNAIMNDDPGAAFLVQGTTDVIDDDVGAAARVFSFDTGNLFFFSGATDGNVTLNTTVTQLDATLGNSGDLTVNETGNLALGAILADVLDIEATGNLTDDGNNATRVAGSTLTLDAGPAGTIGAAAGNGQIDTEVTSINAIGPGGIFIGELDGLNALTATSTDQAIQIAANGDVTLTNVNAVSGAININSGAGFLRDGATASVTTTGTATLTAGSIGTDAANPLNTAAGTLVTSTSAANGNQFISDAGTLTLTAAAGTGAVNVTSGAAMNVTTVTGGSATLASTGDMTLGSVNVGTGTASLTATGGALTDAAGTAASVTAATLTANATSIGSGANRFGTNVDTLNTTSSAGQFITEADGVALTAVGGAGTVDVTSGGAMTVTSVTGASATLASTGNMTVTTINVGGGTASLTATGGALTDTGGAALVTAGALTANAATIGTSGNRFDTSVTSIAATTNNGDQFFTEATGVSLTASAGTGAVNVSSGGAMTVTSVTGGSTTLASTGDMTVTTVNVGTGAASLTATGGALTDSGGAALVTAGALTANASTIGTSGNRFNTAANSINATTANGDQFITDQDGLTLTAAAGTGAVNVTSTGTMAVSSVSGGSTTLNSTGDMTVTTVNVGAGSASLTAAGGALTDTGGAAVVTAGAVTTSADSIGTALNRFNTSAGSLNSTTANGDQFVANAGALNLTAAAGTGSVDVTATTMTATNVSGGAVLLETTGDLTVNTVNSLGLVELESTGGQLLDDNDDGTSIAGTTVDLLAATNIGTVTDIAAGTGSSIDVNTAGNLTATVTSNSGEVNLNLVQAPLLGNGAISLAGGVNTQGQILVQSAGNLNATNFAPGAIRIGAGNSTDVGLRSGGVLTLPSAGSVTDAAPDTLAVSGATDVVDNDATPRSLTFASNNLIFSSGAAGGATALNTTVGTLAADVAANLTILETDDIQLNDVDATNVNLTTVGNVTNGAGTAVTANSLTAVANSITLNTAVGALDARANTNITVTNSGALNLILGDAGNAVTVTTGGAMNVTSVIAPIANLTSAGNMTLGSVNTGAGTASLTATGGAVTDAAGNAPSVIASTLTINANTIGSAANRFGTTAVTLNTTTTGDQFITETDAVALTASAGTGAVDVTSGGAMTASVTGGSTTLASATGGMTVGTIDVGAGAANLTATGGALTDGAGSGVSVTAGTLTANATSVGSAANRFGTAVGALTTATTGGQFITEADAVTLTAAAGAGAVDVASGGAMTVTTVTGGSANLASAAGGMTLGTVNVGAGAANLTATGGALTDAAGSAASITAGSVTLNAGTIGTAANRFGTAASSLNTTSNGDQFITEVDAITLAAAAGPGTVNVTSGGTMSATNVTGGSATLASTGNMSVGTLNVGAGTASLTATGGTLTDGAGVSVTAGTLTANATSIGTSAADRFETAVNTLNTTTTANQFLSDQGTVTLNAAAGTGAVDATSTGAMTATVAGGSTTLNAGGGLTINTVNVGGGAASLTTSGALVDSGAGIALTAGAATLSATSIGTSANRLNTSVASLTGSTTAGGMFITEANAVTLGALNTTGVGNTINIQASGAVTQAANFLSANGPVVIDATSISMSAGTSTLSNGGAITYLARTGNIQLSLIDANTGDVFLAAGGNLVSNGPENLLDVRGGTVELRAGAIDANGVIGADGQGVDVLTTSSEATTLFIVVPGTGNQPFSNHFVNFPGGGSATELSVLPAGDPDFFDVDSAGSIVDDVSRFVRNTEVLNPSLDAYAGEEEDDTSIDWSVFDPNVSLFGTVGQPVRLPADQLEEEEGTQVSMLLVPAGETLVVTQHGLRRVKVYRAIVASSLGERS